MGDSCWALSSNEPSPAIKMQQIVLLTHLYLVTSIPSNYIELPPVQCCLPFAGFWKSYWWEKNPSTCSAQVLSRVYVEMVISAQLCSLLSLSHLGSQLVLLDCVTTSMAKWPQESKNEAYVPMCFGFGPLTSYIMSSSLRWQRFHWDAWKKCFPLASSVSIVHKVKIQTQLS